jgi:stage VI sporulation protein D
LGGGLIMSSKQYTPIRFQVEESIWLDHHSRAAEITSLELEPEVEVVEESELVVIKGNLVLTGRFETAEGDDEESLDLESSSLADQLHFKPLRVEQKEIYQKEHRGKIEKKFPVDVTVPSNKVDDLEDVYVQVDQFDYTISEGHRLNIQAEVLITGIRTESNSLPLTFDVAAAREERLQEERMEDDEFETEIEADVETKRRLENGNIAEDARPENELNFRAYEEQDNDEDDQENVIPIFNQEIRTNFQSSPSVEDSYEEDEEDEESNERIEQSKTTGFLTQLMSGKTEEERDVTRLKMCIVQRDESLDLIAARYEIQVQDIMRTNRLESEQISEGQLLYIPKS